MVCSSSKKMIMFMPYNIQQQQPQHPASNQSAITLHNHYHLWNYHQQQPSMSIWPSIPMLTLAPNSSLLLMMPSTTPVLNQLKLCNSHINTSADCIAYPSLSPASCISSSSSSSSCSSSGKSTPYHCSQSLTAFEPIASNPPLQQPQTTIMIQPTLISTQQQSFHMNPSQIFDPTLCPLNPLYSQQHHQTIGDSYDQLKGSTYHKENNHNPKAIIFSTLRELYAHLGVHYNPVPWNQSFGMERVWMSEFREIFSSFRSELWSIQPVDSRPTTNSNIKLHQFVDSAKVRFCCERCSHSWTSMKGRIMFWFNLLPPNFKFGIVAIKLFGQRCDECKIDNSFEQPMWYPEEVTKVLKNLYYHIGQIFYGFEKPKYERQRRMGKPRTQHNKSLCQACHEGVCLNRIYDNGDNDSNDSNVDCNNNTDTSEDNHQQSTVKESFDHNGSSNKDDDEQSDDSGLINDNGGGTTDDCDDKY